MSKNFVREIDHINNINKLDFNTNKVNDLLSTRAQNYIRTENRGYHCLTDNVKATRAKNVTYNGKQLITIDNTDVPTTNENTLNGQQLVSVINEMATDIQELENEIATLREKKPYILSTVYNTDNHFSASVFTNNLYNDEGLQRFYLTVFVAKATNEPFTKIELNLRNANYNFNWSNFTRAMLNVPLTDPNITDITFDFDTRKLTITTNETASINTFFNLKLDLYEE